MLADGVVDLNGDAADCAGQGRRGQQRGRTACEHLLTRPLHWTDPNQGSSDAPDASRKNVRNIAIQLLLLAISSGSFVGSAETLVPFQIGEGIRTSPSSITAHQTTRSLMISLGMVLGATTPGRSPLGFPRFLAIRPPCSLHYILS